MAPPSISSAASHSQLPGAVESSHMGHPDFRLNNRIFATLSAQEKGCGVLKLTLEQQQAFITELPSVFAPVHGGWGRMGMTFIHLAAADEAILAGRPQPPPTATSNSSNRRRSRQKKHAKKTVQATHGQTHPPQA